MFEPPIDATARANQPLSPKPHGASSPTFQHDASPSFHRPPTPDGQAETEPTVTAYRALPKSPESIASEAQSLNNSSDCEELDYAQGIFLEPISFAKPTAIPRNREGMRKPGGGSEVTTVGKVTSLGLIKKAANGLYRYGKIDSDEIRILLIKPGAENDDLNAALLPVKEHRLKEDDFNYAALSYNWGDGETDDTIIIQDDVRSKPITSFQGLVDGALNDKGLRVKRLLIRPNLYQALKHLRLRDRILPIWVDALCINQTNEAEKQSQVMKMALIYRNAYNVCIWLGSDDSDDRISDVAMKFIPEAIAPNKHAALLTDPVYLPKWAGLFELLRWSW
jgi:hypothetical protein